MGVVAMDIWKLINHFSKNANWGDPNKMAGTLLLAMDAIREYCNMPIVINCGYATSGHVTHSYHYKGMACDWHFESSNPKLSVPEFLSTHVKIVVDALDDLQLDEFVGLGIYPYWHKPGFHLDVRGYRARWWRDGKGIYHPWSHLTELTHAILSQHSAQNTTT